MKDIFIDNNVAKNFASPVDENYKKLIAWINDFDPKRVKDDPTKILDYAHLVVSQKLLVEYVSSSRDCSKPNAMPVLVNKLLREGRLQKKSKSDISEFKLMNFKKSVSGSLLSNTEDHCHIVTVLLSNRKMCLTYDENLTHDLKTFPGFEVLVEKRPERLNYK
jgi:hypothetical protein